MSSNLILATKVVKQLTKSDKTLALAESITGGGLGMAITEVSGSSKVFAGAIVAYSDIAKIKLLEVPKRLKLSTQRYLKR